MTSEDDRIYRLKANMIFHKIVENGAKKDGNIELASKAKDEYDYAKIKLESLS